MLGGISTTTNRSDHPLSSSDQNEKFRTLLEKIHTFPTVYLHKFIGKNTDAFKDSVREFEGKFSGLTRTSEKTSSNQAHLALTYQYEAKDPEAVIALTQATHALKDLLFIL